LFVTVVITVFVSLVSLLYF